MVNSLAKRADEESGDLRRPARLVNARTITLFETRHPTRVNRLCRAGPDLRKKFVDDATWLDSGQTRIQALEFVAEFVVVDTQLTKLRRVHGHFFLDSAIPSLSSTCHTPPVEVQNLLERSPRRGIENMPIGISPLVDFAFKLMLASRGHERVTIHFLNAILGEQVKIQIHVLELTKLTATRDNLKSAAPAERWAYFLLNAENLTVAEIRDLFPEPEFAEAAGVLEMIKDNPDQMSDYISRLKYKLDEGWRIESTRAEALREGREEGLKEGREEGREQGREQGLKEGELKGKSVGELIGQIVILQELLGMTVPGREELSYYDAIQLKDLCSQLRLQLRSRQSS